MRNTIERLVRRRALTTAGLTLAGAAALTACGSMTPGSIPASKAPTTAVAPVTPSAETSASATTASTASCDPENVALGEPLDTNAAVLVFAGIAKMRVVEGGRLTTEIVARPVVINEKSGPVLTTVQATASGYSVGTASTPFSPSNPNLTVYTSGSPEHSLDGCVESTWYPDYSQTQVVTLTGDVLVATEAANGEISNPIFPGFNDGLSEVHSQDDAFNAGVVSMTGADSMLTPDGGFNQVPLQ